MTCLPVLSNAVCPCHRLQVVLRIEVAVVEDDGVCGSQVETLTTTLGAQQKHKRVRVVVELTDCQVAFLGSHRTIQTLVWVVYGAERPTDTRLTAFFPDQPRQASTRKAKPIWIVMKQEMMGWQWHQLDYVQIIFTSLQTDIHSSTSFFTDRMFFQGPINQQCQTTACTGSL